MRQETAARTKGQKVKASTIKTALTLHIFYFKFVLTSEFFIVQPIFSFFRFHL